MPDEFDARIWALAGGPWKPLKGLVAEAAELSSLDSTALAVRLMNAVMTGEIAIRVPISADRALFSYIATPRAAEIYKAAGTFDLIDWASGRLRVPDLLIEAFWPDVVLLMSQIRPVSTAPLAPKESVRKGGRPVKYDREVFQTWMLTKLTEDGCPKLGSGEQAKLEEEAAVWFSTRGESPAESTVRDRVVEQIRAMRIFLGAGN